MQHNNKKHSGLFATRYWLLAIVVVWILQIAFGSTINPYFFTIIMYSGINIILAVSLNLVFGFTGQFSIGHAGFMAVGGYLSSFLSLFAYQKFPEIADHIAYQEILFLGVLIAAGICSAGIGYILGLPTLRLKGDYLAIVTLGFGEIIRVLILNTETVGGARGLPGIPSLSNFGWVYTMVIITVFTVWRILHAVQGREMLAVREDEIAAESMGVPTTRAKVRAFMIGAFFAGISGALFAHFLRYLNPSTFDFNRSFEVIIMVVLGGMGSVTGSVIAAVFLTVLKEALRALQDITQIDLRMVIYALVLIIMMLTRPQGIFGTKELRDIWRRKAKS